MHILQPRHTKLKSEEVKEVLENFNISLTQLPKIRSDDPGIPEGCQKGEIIKIERKEGDESLFYYRVVA